MKKTILFAAVAGAVLGSHAALAAQSADDAAPAAVPAAVAVVTPPALPVMPLLKSKWMASWFAMSREIQAGAKQGNLVQILDAQSTLRYTPETSKLLLEVFGNEHPISVTRQSGAKGQPHYVVGMASHSYQEADGLKIDWSELRGVIDTDKAGRHADATFSWPSMVFDGPQLNLGVHDMSFDSKQSLAGDGMWYGNQHIHVNSVVVGKFSFAAANANAAPSAGDAGVQSTDASSPAQAAALRIDGIDFKGGFTRHGKFSDYRHLSTIDSIGYGDEHVEHVNMGLRLLHIDPAVLMRFKAAAAHVKQAGRTDEQISAATLPIMKEAGKSLIKQGAELVIDDISASYHGHSASLKGRVGFARVVEQDFDAPMTLLKKLVAHFDVRVSLKLVQDVARTIAGKQLTATLGQRPAQEDIDRSAKTIASGMLDKAVTDGFVRIEDGELRMAIDFKDGKLTVNGKAIPLPNMDVPRGAGVVLPHEPKNGCGWPALPADAQQSGLALRMKIDASGHASDIHVIRSSGSVLYDRLSIGAAGICAWVPGIASGKPAAMPLTWTYTAMPPAAVAPAEQPQQ